MPDRSNRLGQQLGNYYLTRLLGEGGFAEVYLGKHIHLETQAAIKVFHTQLTRDNVEAFRTEARIIAHLDHPHIVRILDFNVERNTPFLVMDYASGGTLRKRYSEGTILPVATIASYVKQLADALQYAHDKKMIHRDIKPENMLLDRHHNILLSDFGIALVAQSSRYQSIQEVDGTAAYMSPEQIQGKPCAASDQYALGIVIYEWLCGNRPFHGSFVELLAQHLYAPPPPLRRKVPMISSDLEHVVMTVLAKDSKQRFVNVQAFAEALQLAIQPGQSLPPVTLVTPPKRPLQSPPPPQTATYTNRERTMAKNEQEMQIWQENSVSVWEHIGRRDLLMPSQPNVKLPAGEPIPQPLDFIWIIDCSRSMAGGKIQSLNTFIREIIPEMQRVARSHPHAQVVIRAVKFSSSARWHVPQPTPVEQFTWQDLRSGGDRDMGQGLCKVAEYLNLLRIARKRGFPPVLVLIANGYPTDDFESGLRTLMAQSWARKAVRLGIGIGNDIPDELLQRFINNPEISPLRANNAVQVIDYINWAEDMIEDNFIPEEF